MAAAAEEMSSNMNAIAAASEQAVVNVNMVSSATEEMNAIVNEISGNTTKGRDITEQALLQQNEHHKELMNLVVRQMKLVRLLR